MTTQELRNYRKENNVDYYSLGGDTINIHADKESVQEDLHQKMEKRNCNDLYVKIQDDTRYFEHNNEIYNKIIELQNLLLKNS